GRCRDPASASATAWWITWLVAPQGKAGLRYHGQVLSPGAQTERRGEAGPVSRSARRRTLTSPCFWSSDYAISRLQTTMVVKNGWPRHGVRVMSLTIEAVYENGVLRPTQPLPLQEHQKVRVTVQTETNWVDATAGILGWTGDPEELRRLALSPTFDLE